MDLAGFSLFGGLESSAANCIGGEWVRSLWSFIRLARCTWLLPYCRLLACLRFSLAMMSIVCRSGIWHCHARSWWWHLCWVESLSTRSESRLERILHLLLWLGHIVLLLVSRKWHSRCWIVLITAETAVIIPLMEVLLRIKVSSSSELPWIIVEWLLMVHILVTRLLLHLELLLPMWLWLPRSTLGHRTSRILLCKLRRRRKWF